MVCGALAVGPRNNKRVHCCSVTITKRAWLCKALQSYKNRACFRLVACMQRRVEFLHPCWEVASRRRAVPGTHGSFFLLIDLTRRSFFWPRIFLVDFIYRLLPSSLLFCGWRARHSHRLPLAFRWSNVEYWIFLLWSKVALYIGGFSCGGRPHHHTDPENSSTGKSKRGQRKGAEKKA